MYDLVLLGGTLVTPGGRRRAHIYVQDGLIADISDERVQATQSIDVSGMHVLAGMIDGHVHFQDPGDTTREDFISGSSAAAVGGVTTVIEHTHSDPVRTLEFLEHKVQYLRDRSLIDFGLAAHAWPDQIGQHTALWQAGVTFFKVFTCTTHGVPGHDAAHLLELFRELAAVDALCLVHCEDESITSENERALRAAGRNDPSIISEWRSREAELTALSTMGLLARVTGVRAIAAHVSTATAIDLIDRERRLGARLALETCPQYLYLYETEILEHPTPGLRKFTPPARIRAESDAVEMWSRVAQGPITHISTDHAPATRAHKTDGSIWEVHFGLPGVETTLNLLLNASIDGLLPLERATQLVSESPARLYGLYPRKGRLAVGADADLVVADLAAERTLDDASVVSKAGWTPYHGRRIKGRVVMTFSRGQLVAHEGRPIGEPGHGRFLPGPGLQRTSVTTSSR